MSEDVDVIVITETETVIETVEVDTLIEESAETDVIETASVELLVEESPDTVIEEASDSVLIEEVEVVSVLETAAEQGPPGPVGPIGPQGPSGISTVGGFDVVVEDPQPGDVLALNTDLHWMNDRVMDGGNF